MAAAHTRQKHKSPSPSIFFCFNNTRRPSATQKGPFRFDSRVTSDLSVGCDTKAERAPGDRNVLPASERDQVCALCIHLLLFFSPFLSIRDGGAAGTKAPAPATRGGGGGVTALLVSPLGAQDVCKHQHFRPRIRPCGGRSHTLVRSSPIINPLTG
jgi:hypothetical protein